MLKFGYDDDVENFQFLSLGFLPSTFDLTLFLVRMVPTTHKTSKVKDKTSNRTRNYKTKDMKIHEPISL